MDVRVYTDAFSIDVYIGGVGGSEGNIAAHGEESETGAMKLDFERFEPAMIWDTVK